MLNSHSGVVRSDGSHIPISEYFGELTFGLGQMRERLPRDAYQDLVRSLDQGRKISKQTADAIAKVIMDWAVKRGATHFCHWFQPMTGLTAEKHDSFISIQHSNHSELKVIERFTGSQLIQGEPDASSFPSGGMRSTFEARGYTAWDPTSPLFIIEGPKGNNTLCIPTVFFGYHGQALDNKTPLLRSVQTLSTEACSFLKLLGDVDVKSVMATLGPEQEYFLVDKEVGSRRPDLLMSGRTLLGAPTARGQKLEDHYFGSIPPRVQAFMEDLEHELYRLGIPVKTRHNEVAPSQFEMAPIFENISIAADHNTLAMETMKRIAARHGFMCLLHEKPFAAINGSGKHCNWSIANDKGENLLDPGHTPHQNLRFLAVAAVVIRAVNKHAGMLAASIMSPGNDLRLGGNEAPPNIISVFLGSMLETIYDSIGKGEAARATEAQIIELGVSHIPDVAKDYTDRNRTSPFAFTGNKFEFRAVGATANVAVPSCVLNAAVTDAFTECTARLKTQIAKGVARDEAVMALIRELINENKGVLFSGNNYSAEWREEAKRRGLPIIGSAAEGLAVWNNEKATEFLVSTKTLTRDEIAARYHIHMERYVKTSEIELETTLQLVREYVIPAVEQQLARTYGVTKDAKLEALKTSMGHRLGALERTMTDLLQYSEGLHTSLGKLNELTEEPLKVDLLVKETKPLAAKLRRAADQAEQEVAHEFWSLPKYRELLFHPSMR
ncbi:glutamine synthetase [Planctomyces bekefii]|uniref:Glutamine synthetase n=1 Tax=Planctomyces bekefii TaxID=1653850 RepID=A0A5C6M6Y1_9PLAN|nr:glutamine synthetase [Planctomyces bekefii]